MLCVIDRQMSCRNFICLNGVCSVFNSIHLSQGKKVPKMAPI